MPAPRAILVVDDEQAIVRILHLRLVTAGYTVRTASGGEEALTLLSAEPVDLVILDVTMPGMDGFATLRQIRRTSRVPVIMLTGWTRATEKVQALRDGADDYLTKPFNPDELVARVAAVLRRAGGEATGVAAVLRYGEVTLDLAQRRVLRAGEEVRLSRMEWEFLAALASTPGKVLLQRELGIRLWGMDYDAAGQPLRAILSRLRGKLGTAVPITTFPGLGYRLESPR